LAPDNLDKARALNARWARSAATGEHRHYG
jgi:hypothetical protein